MSATDSQHRLSGKRAVISGGAGGIGRATALRFEAEGARVVVADWDRGALSEAWRAAAATDGRVHTVVTDVRDREAVAALMGEAEAWLGGIDVLVNAAGVTGMVDPFDMAEDEWDRVIDINLKGTWLMCQAAARVMRGTGGGAIVNLSSVSAEQSLGHHPHYAASKGGIRQLTKSLAVGYAASNIRVNAVGPGPVATAMGAAEVASPENAAKVLARVLRGRHGLPEEIASVIVFLASDEASFVTGTTVYADGGVLASR